MPGVARNADRWHLRWRLHVGIWSEPPEALRACVESDRLDQQTRMADTICQLGTIHDACKVSTPVTCRTAVSSLETGGGTCRLFIRDRPRSNVEVSLAHRDGAHVRRKALACPWCEPAASNSSCWLRCPIRLRGVLL